MIIFRRFMIGNGQKQIFSQQNVYFMEVRKDNSFLTKYSNGVTVKPRWLASPSWGLYPQSPFKVLGPVNE